MRRKTTKRRACKIRVPHFGDPKRSRSSVSNDRPRFRRSAFFPNFIDVNATTRLFPRRRQHRNAFNGGCCVDKPNANRRFSRERPRKNWEKFKKAPCANRNLWFNYFCSEGNKERKPFRFVSLRTTQVEEAPIAQLDRASVYGTEGYLFESDWVYFFISCCFGPRRFFFRRVYFVPTVNRV